MRLAPNLNIQLNWYPTIQLPCDLKPRGRAPQTVRTIEELLKVFFVDLHLKFMSFIAVTFT